MLASNIRAGVEAHTARPFGQFTLFLSHPPIPSILQAFFARARQDLRHTFSVLFLLFLPGSDVEDGMSSELMEEGSQEGEAVSRQTAQNLTVNPPG